MTPLRAGKQRLGFRGSEMVPHIATFSVTRTCTHGGNRALPQCRLSVNRVLHSKHSRHAGYPQTGESHPFPACLSVSPHTKLHPPCREQLYSLKSLLSFRDSCKTSNFPESRQTPSYLATRIASLSTMRAPPIRCLAPQNRKTAFGNTQSITPPWHDLPSIAFCVKIGGEPRLGRMHASVRMTSNK